MTRRFFPRRVALLQVTRATWDQSTHHRLDRLQIVSVGSLRDQSTTQFHRWRSTNKLIRAFSRVVVAGQVDTRMLIGEIFRGHSRGGPPYLNARAP